MGKLTERKDNMKQETELAVRSVLTMDGEIPKDRVEKALDVLRGGGDGEDDLIHTVRFTDVVKILGVSRRTITYYVEHGYLDAVYGCGKRAIGVTRASIMRFVNRRVVRTVEEGSVNFRNGREAKSST